MLNPHLDRQILMFHPVFSHQMTSDGLLLPYKVHAARSEHGIELHDWRGMAPWGTKKVLILVAKYCTNIAQILHNHNHP